MARKSTGKKLRFEVLKRDCFVCQYCGAHPPTVLLVVDHITPVAEGGSYEIDNLVTACEICNQGKGARLLTSVPESLAQKAADIAEREEQLRGYRQIMDAKADRLHSEAWEVVDILKPGCDTFNRRNLASIRRFLEELGLNAVRDAAELAYLRGIHSEYRQFKYFCAVCWNLIRERDHARAQS